MKRTYVWMLSVILLVSFVGCGSPRTVPDDVVNLAIEEYLSENRNDLGQNIEVEPIITHAPDEKTDSDAVTIELKISCPHFECSSNYEAVYRYNKESKLWNIVQGGQWEALRYDRISLSESADQWKKTIDDLGLGSSVIRDDDETLKYALYRIYFEGWARENINDFDGSLQSYFNWIHDIEHDAETNGYGLGIALDKAGYHLPIKDTWAIEINPSDGENNASILCIAMDTVESSEEYMNRIVASGDAMSLHTDRSLYKIYERSYKSGDNYEFSRSMIEYHYSPEEKEATGKDVLSSLGYVIRQDNVLYFINSMRLWNDPDDSAYYLDDLLQSMGFIPIADKQG